MTNTPIPRCVCSNINLCPSKVQEQVLFMTNGAELHDIHLLVLLGSVLLVTCCIFSSKGNMANDFSLILEFYRYHFDLSLKMISTEITYSFIMCKGSSQISCASTQIVNDMQHKAYYYRGVIKQMAVYMCTDNVIINNNECKIKMFIEPISSSFNAIFH